MTSYNYTLKFIPAKWNPGYVTASRTCLARSRSV